MKTENQYQNLTDPQQDAEIQSYYVPAQNSEICENIFRIFQIRHMYMWWETELFSQEKKLLCDNTILLSSQRLQHHHRLDNYWPLSRYIVSIWLMFTFLLKLITLPFGNSPVIFYMHIKHYMYQGSSISKLSNYRLDNSSLIPS